jgi:Flp pilus assembly protein TadD
LDNRNAEALYGLGFAYSSLEQLTAAESTYLRAVSYRPSDWRAHKQLGLYYQRIGAFEKAVKPLSHVVELTPDNAQGYNNLGVVYYRLGRFDDARKQFERSLELDPRVSALTNLASLEFNAGNLRESIAWSYEALKLEEKGFRIWGNIAAAHARLNELDKSAEANRRAIALVRDEMKVNPKSGLLHSHLAHYLAPLGKRSEAIDAMSQSQILSPTDPDIWYRNAETWAYLGDEEQALHAMREAVKHGFRVRSIPSNSRMAPILKRL